MSSDVLLPGNAVYDYLVWPALCAPNDFWQQVRRTIHGQPLSQKQIDLIVQAVRDALCFQPDDVLLDLCCGNGALSQYFSPDCASIVGVDFSPPLLAVARHFFENPPKVIFVQEEAVSYVATVHSPMITKILCYGALQYLPSDQISDLLLHMFRRFPHVTHVLLGNLPDYERAADFFGDRSWSPSMLDDHTATLGHWFRMNDIQHMAKKIGWQASIRRMPSTFDAALYRFDVLLVRS